MCKEMNVIFCPNDILFDERAAEEAVELRQCFCPDLFYPRTCFRFLLSTQSTAMFLDFQLALVLLC